MVETLHCVAKDVKSIESKKKEVEQMMSSKNSQQFPIDLLVEKRRIVRTELGYTNVVCGARKCVSYVDGEPDYTQICCTGCKSPFMWLCPKMILGRNLNVVVVEEVSTSGRKQNQWLLRTKFL